MSCFINSVFDGKPSKTHKALIEYYGNTPNGELKAIEEYQRLMSNDFLEKFHGDNETHWFKLEDGDTFDRTRFTEQLEPELVKDRTGKLYYVNHNGSRNYLKGKPIAWLSNSAQKELIDNIVMSAITKSGEFDISTVDFENELVIGIDEIIDGLSEFITDFGGTELDSQYLKYKAVELMESKKMVHKDTVEINNELYDELDEENEEEIEDDTRTSNEVVRKESFLKNSKDTASANVKMMLSFVPNIASFKLNEQGNPEIELAISSLTEEMQKLYAEDNNEEESTIYESYKDPHEMWRKIEDLLHDIFTTVDGKGQVNSVISKMESRLAEASKTDPSIGYVNYYLSKFDKNKKIQFAQAFHKHQILFNTTDVSGDEGNFTYKVIDPSAASSKNYKIRQSWNELLTSSSYLNQKIAPNGIVSYQTDKVKLAQAINALTKLGGELANAKNNKKVFSDLSKSVEGIIASLKNIGINTNDLTEQHFQKMLQDMESSLGKNLTPNKFLKRLLDEVIIATRLLSTTSDGAFMTNTGFKSPLTGTPIYKIVSDALIDSSDLIGESTVMIAGGKTAWSMSLPSHLDIVVNKFKNGIYTITDEQGNTITRNRYVEELQASGAFHNHPWLDALHDAKVAKNLTVSIFSAFQKQGSTKYGKDNKNILYADQTVDKIVKTLLPRIEENTKAIFYSPAAADKGRLSAISGLDIFNVDVDISTGAPRVSTKGIAAGSAIDVLVDNFVSEYLRAKQSYNNAKNTTDTSTMVMFYDLKNINDKFTAVNADGVPVGNSIQIQSNPELSPYRFTDKAFSKIDFLFDNTNSKLKKILYSYNGNDVDFLLTDFDVDINGVNPRQLLREYLSDKLDTRITEAIQVLENNGIVSLNPKTNQYVNLKLDKRLWKNYADKYSMLDDRTQATYTTLYELIADYTLNGMISTAGYNKLFAGDIAYYKDSVDYNKRIPATYTDGKYLMIDDKKDLNFNVAVIKGIEISAKDLGEFRTSFVKSIKEQMKFMDEETKKIYTTDYINALAENYTSQYNNVNTTDAQAWISLDRWKFLKENLGEWNSKANAAFERLKDGTFTYEDLKFSAQPLKGVYFNQNNQTGVPTYLKYSQAVLIPKLVKGTQLEYLSKQMDTDKVAEVITLDGVKVGALSPTTIHDDAGNLLSDVKLNIYQLSNLNWKLQQQLPVKGMKNSMDVGSQLQKNVVSNIFAAGQYGSRNGQQVIDDMNRVVSDLTLMAFNETIQSLGLDVNGKIENKDKFYDTLSKLAIDKGVPAFAVEALNRGYELDAIPQLRYKIQNIISSSFNNNIAKNQTPGGSFIQISNFGVTRQNLDDVNSSGIFMLKDVNELSRPKFTTDENGKAKVSSGQVFLPHSLISKYIPEYASLTREQLLARVDKELFNIIGYRIPNQKLSSNQPLEVVGILPDGMGDSIMMYTEITTQTGSDFDIDKTYVMLPAFDVVKENGKNSLRYVKLIKQEGEEVVNPNKKQLQNELFEIYFEVLSAPLSYVDMMSGIDGSQFKDEINRLHGGKEELTSLQILDPTYQLKIKFDNIVGKSGVGLTANQMVDHVYTQMAGVSMIDQASVDILGKYIHTNDENIDLSKIFDKSGAKITDSISMFLNAYVDIAKDPYVTKGNFNTYTSNTTFLLLRAGMPLTHVVSFIGQPALKQLIAEYESTLSSLPSTVNKRQTLKEAEDNLRTKNDQTLGKIINTFRSNENTKEFLNLLTETYNKTANLEMISKESLDKALLTKKENTNFLKLLSGNIDNIIAEIAKDKLKFGQNMTNLGEYLAIQDSVLTHFITLQSTAEKLSEQVLISKADVNGGGHDIVTHFTNNNRYNKVIQEGLFINIENKFKPGTMLGAKTLYTMKFFDQLDSNLFITMDPMVKSIYPMITQILKGDAYATNAELVKNIERSLYASFSQSMLTNSPYETTKKDIKNLLDPATGIISRINSAKLNDKYNGNKLIQALEVIKETNPATEEGAPAVNLFFLSVDNFTRKPDSLMNDLSDAWQELLDSEDKLDQQLAQDLVKYAIFTSGLSKNRHSIFEFMPIEVADYMNRGIQKLKDTGLDAIGTNFMEDFMRHSQNADFRTSASLKDLTAGVRAVSPEMMGLSGLDKRIKLVRKEFNKTDKVSYEQKNNAETTQFKIESYKLYKDGNTLMDYVGTIQSLDGTSDLMVLAPTYSLGLTVGNGNVYEYNQNKSSLFAENNPGNFKNIQDSIKRIKNETDFVPHVFDLSKTLTHYGKNIQVTEYNAEEARQQLIKKGLIIENKC
tara:strand:+ start:18661 stop:25443 length:6783 start_codon:yes stop_codon:yes gene_type:complete